MKARSSQILSLLIIIASALFASVGRTETEKVMTLPAKVTGYALKSGVLKPVLEIPKGATITVSKGTEPDLLPYVNKDGDIVRNTSGFVGGIYLNGQVNGIDEEHVEKINSLPNGLYISATVLDDDEPTGASSVVASSATIPVVPSDVEETKDWFHKFYEMNGRPKFSWSKSLRHHAAIGKVLNQGVESSSIPKAQDDRNRRVFAEIVRAVDRKHASLKELLIIPQKKAVDFGKMFRKSWQVVSDVGAWSIAVFGIAEPLGYGNTPCAEFASEVIREAYLRAGYMDDLKTDFKDHTLKPSNTASVEGLSLSLISAGWIPWEMKDYVPPTGAIMTAQDSWTPGHVYFNGGDNGLIIVDNGGPKGRNLRLQKEKYLGNMYNTGVFYLPPGFNPKKWDNVSAL